MRQPSPSHRRAIEPLFAVALLLLLLQPRAAAGAPLAQRGTRALSHRDGRRVVNALFAFQKPKVRGGKLLLRQAGQGLRDYESTPPEKLLGTLLGQGQLRIERGGRRVLWRDKKGVEREIGTLHAMAGERVFKPSRRVKKARDRLFGERMVSHLIKTAERSRYGRWAKWHTVKVTTPRPNLTRITFEGWVRPPHGNAHGERTDFLSKAAGGLKSLHQKLSSVVGTYSSEHAGVSISWTSRKDHRGRDVGPGKLVRHRLVIRPRSASPHKGEAMKLLAIVVGDQRGGGAYYEAEVFEPGKKRERVITRKQVRAANGWLKAERARFTHLQAQGSSTLVREIAVARGMWQLGKLSFDKPQPAVSRSNTPNIMMVSLLGKGRLRFGPSAGGERAVYWERRDGRREQVGRLSGEGTNARFSPTETLRNARDAMLGHKALAEITKYKTRRKGYGWDADRTYEVYNQRETERSSTMVQTTSSSGSSKQLPSKRAFSVTETSGHVCDSIGRLFYSTPISGVLGAAPSKDKPIVLRWTSNKLPDAGTLATLAAGKVAHHELTLAHGQIARYRYEVRQSAE